jgi:hypothetical protein
MSLIVHRLRQSGEWSDFTVVAQGKSFPVHRVRYVLLLGSTSQCLTIACRLCKESTYFKAVCDGGFAVSHSTQLIFSFSL